MYPGVSFHVNGSIWGSSRREQVIGLLVISY